MPPVPPTPESNRPGYWHRQEGASDSLSVLYALDCKFCVWQSRLSSRAAIGKCWLGSLQRASTNDVFWLEELEARTEEGAQQECLSRASGYLQLLAETVGVMAEVLVWR